MKTNPSRRELKMQAQPTETSCGPTCLQAVYQHFEDDYALEQIISDIPENPDGGTYSVMLANHALKRGYQATIYSYNLRVFDPTWANLKSDEISKKLAVRREHSSSKRARANLSAYIEYLERGGTIRFDELDSALLAMLLAHGNPVIAGLNSTHLYRTSRLKKNGKDDDVTGDVEGHFVTLFEYDHANKQILVADPYHKNPLSDSLIYAIDPQRLINSVMLGIVTYDANLLLIEKK
ncbi:C39 family peptidase [Pelagicoccus sp. SDUM812005]|uniref:C39 family peptidase n=1 Tax=Pelagicoccus sp. SDUM812005 TaxID=3041257 RepID=UPI00280E4F74|nr:C39 family peptidase [Pelagicoccus sp. SDUM812005]MDQ8180142.1 C39 family peptidase [Pelagicoccus sp. SDUM812005]